MYIPEETKNRKAILNVEKALNALHTITRINVRD